MVFFFSLLVGCPAEFECSEEQACPLGSVCTNGSCVEQSCATSDQCPIEQFCSSDRVCTPGCEADSDCKFGDICDVGAGMCASTQCYDTHIDCGFGEFCNPGGECYDAGGYYCEPCNDDGDCGGNGNMCLSFGYCGVACDSSNDCPAGYQCGDVVDLSGNVVSHQCYTACYLYD